MPAQFELHRVCYLPSHQTVTIVVRATDGPFTGNLHDLYTTQAALDARCEPGMPWSDAEVIAEATELLGEQGGEL